MSDGAQELTAKLILDSTKVGWHRDRVEAWHRGERVAPITMDIAWTRRCNAACDFCIQEDQLISMSDGTFMAIKDVRQGDSVRSISPDGDLVASIVRRAWQSSPMAPTLQLSLSSYKLVCTGNHPVLTKKGWVRADELESGQEIMVEKNARKQSDETTGGGRQSGCYPQSAGGLREIRGTVKEVAFGREGQVSKIEQIGAGRNFSSHDHEQSNEAPGSGEGGIQTLHTGTQKTTLGSDEGILAFRENYAERVWQREERIRKVAGACSGNNRLSVRWRRQGVDFSNRERNSEESRFRLQGSKSCFSSERNILPQRPREVETRTTGLPISRMEGVDFLVAKSRITMASSDSTSNSDELLNWQRIVAIEPGPDSAVYDLECFPHHNFVASGCIVHNCAAKTQASASPSLDIPRDVAFQFLEDAAEIGVKGISLISDGESSLVDYYAESIEYAAKLGIKIGLGTNGIAFDRALLERILPHVTYMRFNFSAGEKKRYAEIMGVKEPVYDRVIANIKDAVDVAKTTGTNINMNLVSDPKDGDQLMPFSKLAKELGVHYAIIKHCFVDDDGMLKVKVEDYPKVIEIMKECEKLSEHDGSFRVVAKWNRIGEGSKREYKECYGAQFIMQMSGNGLIAPCGPLFSEKFKAFHIGNIMRTRFKDIFLSDRYQEVMGYLGSSQFNASQRCAENCLQHHSNTWLYKFKAGERTFPLTPMPAHHEFI